MPDIRVAQGAEAERPLLRYSEAALAGHLENDVKPDSGDAPVIYAAPGKTYDDFQLAYALDLLRGKETVATTALDALPTRIVKMPDDTIVPFVLTVGMTILFTGLLLRNWTVTILGGTYWRPTGGSPSTGPSASTRAKASSRTPSPASRPTSSCPELQVSTAAC